MKGRTVVMGSIMAVEAWLDGDDRGAAGRIWAADGRWWRRIVAADRVQHVFPVILGGLDRPSASPPEARRRQPWLPALVRVMEHHTGAPAVHRKSCAYNVYFAI
ncbi:hypothetical protein ACLOJK_026096 [Asimina triloba]